jgi:4-hydroxy-tetrahydrodipicolinate synthase
MNDVGFGTVITAMVTPFTDNGEVNYEVASKLARHLVENGSDALVICGTTGESPTLTREEEYQLFRVVKEAIAASGGKLIAGTGSNCTAEAIEATEVAAAIGVDGVLQVVPYYNKPPQAGLYEHFRQVAAVAPELPMMLYNIPGRTGQNMFPETIARLAEIPNIVAVKEASGNLEQVAKVRQLTPPNFAIYSGDDFLTLPMLTLGARGIVSVASHLVGKDIQEMIESFHIGKTARAVEINLQLTALFKVLFCATNPIPIKTALAWQGWEVGGFRSPLIPLEEQLKPELEKVLKELKLI